MTTALIPGVQVLGFDLTWDQPFAIIRWLVPENAPGFVFKIDAASPTGVTGYKISSKYGSRNLSGQLEGSFFPSGSEIVTLIHLYDLGTSVARRGSLEVSLFMQNFKGDWNQKFTVDISIPEKELKYKPLGRVIL